MSGTSFIVDAIAAGHTRRQIDPGLSHGAGYPGRTAPGRGLPGRCSLTPEEVNQRIERRLALPVVRNEPAKRPPRSARQISSKYAGALTEEQAREAARCLRCGVCSECNQCVYACRAGAIDHDDVERMIDLQVGAVILTPGLEPMPGDIRPEYGYGRYPNVVTSLEFERMLSASGPFAGVVQRPSDGAHPRKVAWIQCVGSRDCTIGVDGQERRATARRCAACTPPKRPSSPESTMRHIEPTIFYIDIRSFGKGFEPYIERAKNEHGVRYMRCMVSSVKEVPGSHNLRLSFVTYEGRNGKRPVFHEEEFDMVVLSVGLRPTPEATGDGRAAGRGAQPVRLCRDRRLCPNADLGARRISWPGRLPSPRISPRRSSRPPAPRRRSRPCWARRAAH